jgi:hypothetical protein
MSLIQRVTRAFQTLSTIELDEQSRFGALGELYAERLLDDEQGMCLTNPIIPHPGKPGLFLESDFLLFTQGHLFCIEIKTYRGRISYPYRPGIGFDDSRILQEKRGNYGEALFSKEHRNPLKKTKYFLHHLKAYLCKIDPRCRNLYIYPVVGFSDLADISAIYDFEAGMISIAHLPAFFERHRDPARPIQPPPWLRQVFSQIPTWDRFLTTRGEWINGVLLDRELVFQGTDRRVYRLPYHDLDRISLQRAGLFSAYDQLTVTFLGGQTASFQSVKGELHLRRFGTDIQTHQLRNVSHIVLGVANKRLR